jgi:hypothetical protein
MFRKLNPSQWEWQTVASIGAFLFTLAVFLFFIIRALRMKRQEAERLGRMPVDDDLPPPRAHEPPPGRDRRIT